MVDVAVGAGGNPDCRSIARRARKCLRPLSFRNPIARCGRPTCRCRCCDRMPGSARSSSTSSVKPPRPTPCCASTVTICRSFPTEVRGATQLECGEEQALAWAREIARRATPDVDAPDVSIVVPVYDQLPFTLACIDALLAHGSRYSFEILVGDDALHRRDRRRAFGPHPRVRHVRHAANLGFVPQLQRDRSPGAGRHVVPQQRHAGVAALARRDHQDAQKPIRASGLVGSS